MEDAVGQESKSPRKAVLLAALPGLVCCLGIGHLYAGRVRRDCCCCWGAGGWPRRASSASPPGRCANLVIPPPGQPIGEPPAAADVFLTVGIVSFLSLVSLWIWQMIDARAICKQYNSGINR